MSAHGNLAPEEPAGLLACHTRLLDALGSGADSRASLAEVCRTIRVLTGCDAVQVWRGDIRQMTMYVLIVNGYSPTDEARLLGLAVPMHDMPLADDFLERRYATLPHAQQAGEFSTALFDAFGIQSAAFLLLERGERVLGALQLSWRSTPTATFPSPELAALAAQYASIAVDVHAKTDEAIQVASNLSETAMLLASIRDPEALLEAMARRIADAVGCDWGTVHLRHDGDKAFRYAAGWGPAEALALWRDRVASIAETEIHFHDHAEGDVIEVLDVRDMEALRDAPHAQHVSSFVSLALRRADSLVGVLSLGYCSRTGHFSRRQITLAKGLAHHAAAALDTAHLVRSLEETNQVKSDFVAAVSHDLRTPLHILIGYAEMLLEDAVGPLTDAQRDLVAKIHERSTRFLELIGGILEVARLDAGRGALRDDTVVLESLCAEVAREASDLKRRTVALEWVASPGTVQTDAPKIRMILRNLVSNALKFTQEGRVGFRVEHSPEDNLCILVEDTGPGVAADDRETLFDMFKQGESGRRAGGSGLGLGLYLVKRIAEVMGGSARLVSGDPGHTVFAVEIPLARV